MSRPRAKPSKPLKSTALSTFKEIVFGTEAGDGKVPRFSRCPICEDEGYDRCICYETPNNDPDYWA